MKLQPEDTRGLLRLSCIGLGVRIARVYEHADHGGVGLGFVQHLQPDRRRGGGKEAHARHIAARPGEAGDEAKLDRVTADGEDDGNRCGCRLGR